MLITRTNPAGIDSNIQDVQQQLHSNLITAWGIDPEKYKCYGRCYRNKTLDNGYIAEVYTAKGEYKEVYHDDSYIALSFFGVSNRPIDQTYDRMDVHLVFFVDLKKLALKDVDGNVIQHRADEECRQIVHDAIPQFSYGFEYKSTEYWIENVLREYPGSRRDERLKYVDMHPVHSFRLNYSVQYDTNCKPFSNF